MPVTAQKAEYLGGSGADAVVADALDGAAVSGL